MELYQDRICFLAGEENALGRFLKEHGKSDRTRAGKMMVAAGKTMSYTGQQRLAIRVPLVRLYQEVDTFRLRAIEDTRWTVDSMEKARTEYRGALLWMKNVSTELDPDTFKQLEKFRKVQVHVKSSKQKFDKLKLDCLQKIDLLAASRCNMFSHALSKFCANLTFTAEIITIISVMYQNTLVTFWDKTSKTMNHVNNGFKGYQYYEFNYIKDLATSSKQLATALEEKKQEKKKDTEKEKDKDVASFPEKSTNEDFQFFNLDEENSISKKDASAEIVKSESLHNLLNLDNETPLLDENDEILLKIDSELEDSEVGQLKAVDDIFKRSEGGETGWPPGPPSQDSEKMLEELLANTDSVGGFTAEWDRAAAVTEPAQHSRDQLFDLLNTSSPSSQPAQAKQNISNQSFLPSQLFELSASAGVATASESLIPPPPPPSSSFPAKQSTGININHLFLNNPSSCKHFFTGSGGKQQKDMSEWFSLFADLDPLANPDNVGQQKAQISNGC